MALFEKVQRLSSEFHEELIQFYREQGPFPIEVRNLLAKQIEATTLCGENYVDNPGQAGEVIGNLIDLLEKSLNKEGEASLPFFVRHKLDTALQLLKENYTSDPLPIYRRMQECLRFEMDLVKRAETGAQLEQDILMDNLIYMKKRVDNAAELLKRMMSEQDAFEINLTEKQALEEHLATVQSVQNPNEQTKNFERTVRDGITQKTMALDANLQGMMRLRNEFWEEMRTNIKSISELQAQIFQDKLFVWKFQQQKAANGLAAVNPVSLDKVQFYLENLADRIWKSRQIVQETERLRLRNAVFNDAQCDPSILLDDLFTLLSNLLNEAFLVEEQPPQVMKKGNKFATAPKVSLLVSNLHIQMSSPCPQVSTCIIREGQARSLSVTETVDIAMPIINGSANLEVNSSTRRLSAKFSTLQLREIKRADRRGSGNSSAESVMEEKLCLLFESWLQVGDLKVRVRTLSLPVVVTSHGSQDPTAEATIMWDNAFGNMGRIPFVVPNRVSWSDLAQVMSAKFLSATGRALSEDNLRCLKQKAFRGNSHSEHITWSEFCKDNLPDRNFSFWHWVYAALKNIERKETHLKDLWSGGHLVGFVEREVAQSMLGYREPGTFMLRFSDSRPGAISISVVNEDRSVFFIAPMDENDLKQKRLANCIRDLEKLKYLFPGIPKDQAFGAYYSAEVQQGPGYVPLLPSIPGAVSSSASSTPTSAGPIFITPPHDNIFSGSPISPLDNHQLLMSPQHGGMYGGGMSNPTSPMMGVGVIGGMSPAQNQQQQQNYNPSYFMDQNQQNHIQIQQAGSPQMSAMMSSMSMDTSQADAQLNETMDDIVDLLNEHQDLLHIIPTIQQQQQNITNNTTSTSNNSNINSGNLPQGTWTNLCEL